MVVLMSDNVVLRLDSHDDRSTHADFDNDDCIPMTMIVWILLFMLSSIMSRGREHADVNSDGDCEN